MYYNRIYVVVFVSFVIFTIVKGSCLEYGHSCWGAHGKRSGEAGGGKLLRVPTNLRSNDNDGPNNKIFFDSINELEARPENNENQNTNIENVDDRSSLNAQDTSKLRNFIWKQKAKLNNRNRMNDDSMEQEERLVQRWRKLPIYKLKPLTKPQLTNPENDLLQQPSKVFVADESLYYDFQ